MRAVRVGAVFEAIVIMQGRRAASEEPKQLFSGGVSCIIREEAVATCVAQTRKSLWYGLSFLPSRKNEMVKSAFFTIGET